MYEDTHRFRGFEKSQRRLQIDDHFHPFVPDFLDFAIFSEVKKSHYLMMAEIDAFLLFSSDTGANEGKKLGRIAGGWKVGRQEGR